MTCQSDTCIRWSRPGILAILATLLLAFAPTFVAAQAGPSVDPTKASDETVVVLDAAADPAPPQKGPREAAQLAAKVEAPALDDKPGPRSAELINVGTYGFAASTGAVLEDMSSGTTLLVAADLDDFPSALAPIGFDFWYDGVRQTWFSANANGLMRLGVAAVGNTFFNTMTSTTNNPHIAPYWDDLWIGNNGKVHYKLVGTAPNRKLVVEWQNMQVPRVATANPGTATYQVWLNESTGVIEFVYGAIPVTTASYSVGLGTSATSFAAVTTSSNTVSYVTANDAQTAAIPAGTKYAFTPNVASTPGALSFTAVGLNTMTLNWADTNVNEVGYAIYRSVDGVNYEFVRQAAADATSSVEIGLASNTTWSWRVVAVTEGGVSAASSGSQATTTGTIVGTIPVGPTGTYASIGAALADINTNGLAGPVILELQATYLSAVETFPLAITSLGSPSNPITIRPAAGATALSITSAVAQTIALSGATNIVFDGRAGGAGPSQLTISNTLLTGVAVQFINGASRNTLQYVTMTGINNTTTGAVVLFSTSTGVTGNNANTIDNCDIRDGATQPVNLILSVGTANTALLNTGNTRHQQQDVQLLRARHGDERHLPEHRHQPDEYRLDDHEQPFLQDDRHRVHHGATHRAIQIIGGVEYTSPVTSSDSPTRAAAGSSPCRSRLRLSSTPSRGSR